MPRIKKNCGPCNSCCSVFAIKDETFADGSPFPNKERLELCKFSDSNKGCSVYENRPLMCKQYECGWKIDDGRFDGKTHLNKSFRPDRSGFIMAELQGFEVKGLLLYETKRASLESGDRKVKAAFRAWKNHGAIVAAIRFGSKKGVAMLKRISGNQNLSIWNTWVRIAERNGRRAP